MSAATVAVRERPILISGPLIAPTMEGRKRNTRRTRGLEDINMFPDEWEFDRWQDGYPDGRRRAVFFDRADPVGIKCPYGDPGDRLWVRETWQVWTEFDDTRPRDLPAIARTHVNYPADGNVWDSRRRPSIHMPRRASRITLELTDVRVERVQEISEADAKAEGVKRMAEPEDCTNDDAAENAANGYFPPRSYTGGFRATWDALNKARGYGWDVNPYVWCLSFRMVRP